MNIADTPVDKSHIINFPVIHDQRGNLTFIEGNEHIPFDIKRTYYLYDVPSGSVRAAHAHKKLHQIYICLSGSCDIHLSDGVKKVTYQMNRSHYGLYIGPMTWRYIDNFSSNSVLLVLASEKYDEADYYRDHQDYLRAREINTDG